MFCNYLSVGGGGGRRIGELKPGHLGDKMVLKNSVKKVCHKNDLQNI